MSHPPSPLPIILSFSLLFSLLPHLPASALPIIPNPDPITITQQQPFHPTPSPPATIPSSPEQSAVSGCPLTLPAAFFPAVKSSCNSGGQLRRDKCCPVLAAWLYSAYSGTALAGEIEKSKKKKKETTSYDMPLLPDDSETCVDGVEKVMRENGVDLVRPNVTCDVVSCFCGIRVHPLSCPQAFWVSDEGDLVGDERVEKLERDCLSGNGNGTDDSDDDRHGYSRLERCSKCLDSLYRLKKGGNGTKSEARTSKMQSRECELMGLTWLLHKNRDAYISTVTKVMRALMMNPQDSDPRSCSLNSDGMPLAVDSLDINGQPS